MSNRKVGFTSGEQTVLISFAAAALVLGNIVFTVMPAIAQSSSPSFSYSGGVASSSNGWSYNIQTAFVSQLNSQPQYKCQVDPIVTAGNVPAGAYYVANMAIGLADDSYRSFANTPAGVLSDFGAWIDTRRQTVYNEAVNWFSSNGGGGCSGGGGGGGGGSTVTVNLSASPSSVSVGGSTTLTWSSTNASYCTAHNYWSGTKATSGSQSVTPTITGNLYSLTCVGANNEQATARVTVTVSTAVTAIISATPNPVTNTAGTTLTWSSTNATSCSASGAWSGAKAISGSESVPFVSSTPQTYSITCTGSSGNATASVVVTFAGPTQPPTACVGPASVPIGFAEPCPVLSVSGTVYADTPFNIQVTPPSANSYSYKVVYISEQDQWIGFTLPGNYVYENWLDTRSDLTVNAAEAGLSEGVHYVAEWDWTWNGQCYIGAGALGCNQGYWRIQQFTMGSGGSGGGGGAAVTVNLSANPNPLTTTAATTLTWSSTNATSCTATGAWNGAKATSGTQSILFVTNAPQTFTLTCSGTSGSQTATVTVTVQ